MGDHTGYNYFNKSALPLKRAKFEQLFECYALISNPFNILECKNCLMLFTFRA